MTNLQYNNNSIGKDLATEEADRFGQQPNNDVIRVKKKRKFFHRHRKLKVFLIIFALFVGLFVVCGMAFAVINLKGKESVTVTPVEYNEGKEIEYKGKKYLFNENNATCLILGCDQRESDEESGHSGQADYVLLTCLDTDTGELKTVSFARDLMVDLSDIVPANKLPYGKETQQLCMPYSYGSTSEQSCEYMIKAVSKLMYNMPIKNYYCINFAGVGPLTETIGGVKITPLETIPNTNIEKGKEKLLIGENARKYLTYRNKNDVESSEQRREREIQFAQEFFKSAFNRENNIGISLKLFEQAQKYSTTSLGMSEFTYLAQTCASKHVKSFDTMSVSGNVSVGEKYVEIIPDQEKLYETMVHCFYKPKN